ncbi:unnamed protein product [Closterium sp. Naga37s-1]|nr:unnamed protein product [Closterium sp. Naga37s-1]
MVARSITGRRLLRLVVAVFLTVSVNASSDEFTEDTTANGGDETINGQQSSPRSHLVGRVGEFEGELNYYLPLRFRTHPERVSLVTRPLGFPLSTARLANVFLHFFEHLPSDNSGASSSSNPTGSAPSTSLDSASVERSISEKCASEESDSEESASGESEWAVKLGCHGPPCPSFGSCTARFPNVQACWNPELVDPPMSEPIPPINCPLKADSAGRGDGSRSQARFDESCSHEQDVGVHGASALQMMRLEDVFVTDNGFALNRTHLFVRNGCPHFPEKVTYDANHMVHELPTAVFNWAHHPANNFYHFLIELVPLFLVAAPLMPSPLRQLPVLVRGGQQQSSTGRSNRVAADILGASKIGMGMRERTWQLVVEAANHQLPAAVINWAQRTNRVAVHAFHSHASPLNRCAFDPPSAISFPPHAPIGRTTHRHSSRSDAPAPHIWQRPVSCECAVPARALLMRARLYIAGHGAAGGKKDDLL